MESSGDERHPHAMSVRRPTPRRNAVTTRLLGREAHDVKREIGASHAICAAASRGSPRATPRVAEAMDVRGMVKCLSTSRSTRMSVAAMYEAAASSMIVPKLDVGPTSDVHRLRRAPHFPRHVGSRMYVEEAERCCLRDRIGDDGAPRNSKLGTVIVAFDVHVRCGRSNAAANCRSSPPSLTVLDTSESAPQSIVS